MKKTTLLLLALALSAATAHAQLLKGIFKGFTPNEGDYCINFTPDGNPYNVQATEPDIAADGTFTYDGPINAGNHDISIYIGMETFGAYLQDGETLQMTFTRGKDGATSVAFGGKNKAVATLVNRITQAYELINYLPMEGAPRPYADNVAYLEKEHASVLPLLKAVKDKTLRDYYTQLNDYRYRYMRIRLMMENDTTGAYVYTPEYKQLMNGVDLNSDMAYRTMLGMFAVMGQMKTKSAFKADNEPFCRELMGHIDRLVTNPNLRRSMVQQVGVYYFQYGDNSGNYHKFYDDLVRWAGNDSVIVTNYKETINSWNQTKGGTPAPDITLTDADGKQVQLLDLCKGKFTYIDVWATWCGPCKKEIPYLAKMVEANKGNDKVQFISISIDEDVNAWKKMIARDQPQWPQYNINGDVSKTFSAQWGITGIPRFIMIDAQGNIFSADTTRPSDTETQKTIDKL